MKKLIKVLTSFYLASSLIFIQGCSTNSQAPQASQGGEQSHHDEKEHSQTNQPQQPAQGEDSQHEHDEHGHDQTTHTGHEHSLDINIKTENIKVGQETQLSTELKYEGKPLTDANVRFEYWTGSGNHTFVDAKENEQGVYFAKVTITAAGEYKLKVHVIKGEEVHDHKETTIKVQ